MRLQDLNWMDVERYLQTDNRIMLIAGATEQHAYLSLMTDVLIPGRIAEAVAAREPVLIAPPLNFGMSQMFGEFPGTISLSRHTFEYILLEIVESLFHQGFRKFFIVNGHQGNELPVRLQDFQMEGVLQVKWYDWRFSRACEKFQKKYNLRIDHGNWSENFTFTRVGELPSAEKPPVNLELLSEVRYARDVLEDGSFGGPYQIDPALMDELFESLVSEVVELLHRMRDD
jgi:creatinine amidohydrolase